MALPNSLSGLTTREAIQDALSRCVNGLDTNDRDVFDSAFTTDAVFDLNGTVMDGLDAIHTGCFDKIVTLDTTHFLSSVRIDVSGASATTAAASASAVAQHYRQGEGVKPGAPQLMSGCQYTFDLVKDAQDGSWKIKLWKLKLVWAQGDWSVVQSE